LRKEVAREASSDAADVVVVVGVEVIDYQGANTDAMVRDSLPVRPTAQNAVAP
jgi:Ni2+-binding GTPase involved in maturation of urease and hydrogenase